MTSSRARVFAIVLGALAGAAAIDIYLVVTEGWVFHVANAMVISQWDASNLLGRAAFFGGWTSAAIGIALHYVVCLLWATLFVALFGATPFLRRQPLLLGLLYGTVVMLAMRFAVVPLGHAAEPPVDVMRLLNLYIAHTLFFGVPLALTVRAVASLARG